MVAYGLGRGIPRIAAGAGLIFSAGLAALRCALPASHRSGAQGRFPPLFPSGETLRHSAPSIDSEEAWRDLARLVTTNRPVPIPFDAPDCASQTPLQHTRRESSQHYNLGRAVAEVGRAIERDRKLRG